MATPLPMSRQRVGRSVAMTRLKKPTLAQFQVPSVSVQITPNAVISRRA
jgi:hypothetical protein